MIIEGTCDVCGRSLRLVHDFGPQPMCNDLRTGAPRFPLILTVCVVCGLVQLDDSSRVPQEMVFPRSYPYRSRHSSQLREEASALAALMAQGRPPKEPGKMTVVLDVGCNDGTFLNAFAKEGFRTYGVDPTDAILDCDSRHVISQCYLSDQPIVWDSGAVLGHGLLTKPNGQVLKWPGFSIVMAHNVFAHVPNPVGFAKNMVQLLHPQGVLVVSNHALESILYGGQWDTIYHEHRRYYSESTLTHTLRLAGIEVKGTRHTKVHGGSVCVQGQRYTGEVGPPLGTRRELDDFADFSGRVESSRAKLQEVVRSDWGRRPVILAGVPSRAGTLISCCGFTRDDIAMAVEPSGSVKIGGFLPGTEIPIVDEAVAPGEAAVLVGAHHLGPPFVRKMLARFGGPAITPFPYPIIYTSQEMGNV